MKTIAIIQARMGSSRLPGKALIDIGGGEPVLQFELNRVKLSKYIEEIYLATTVNSRDDVLKKLADENKIKCYRGSETDVLNSFYQIAKKAKPKAIVRITGDCPLTDYKIIDKVIKIYLDGDFDYVSNTEPPTYPDGLDVEVFSFKAITRAWKEAKLKSEREHVTPYICNNPQMYKIKNVYNNEDLSSYRWTLDTADDLKMLKLIIGECRKNKKYCDMKAILNILKNNPEWAKINKHHQRNEGYLRSLKEDILLKNK